MIKNFAQKISLQAIAIALFFSFTICFFAPTEMYMSNYNVFWFSYADILPIISVCFVAASLLSVLICSLFKRIGSIIIFCLAVAFYVQGNFLQIDYGVLDGTAIPWEEYRSWAIINTGIWLLIIAVLVLLFKFKEKIFNKLSMGLSFLLTAMQLVAMVVLLFTTPPNSSSEDFYLSPQKMFEVSEDKNIITFVLDEFDGAYFNELLEETPELNETFRDFTFFRNASAGATRTKIAIPYILTGTPYTLPTSYLDYIKTAYNQTDLYKTLHKNNFDTRIYTNSIYTSPHVNEYVSNIVIDKPIIGSYPKMSKLLYQFVAFRYAPHIAKTHFEMYTGDFNNIMKSTGDGDPYRINDPLFYQNLVRDGLTLTADHNAFRFYHLNGPHAPYTMNEYSEPIKFDQGTGKQQTLGALNIVSTFIEEMKSLGVYDQAQIYIIADHGLRNGEQNPLTLVKDIGQKADQIVISEAPVSNIDLVPTWINAIQGASNEKSIFDFSETENRDRLFYKDYSTHNTTAIIEYVINGKSYLPDDIQSTGNVYNGNTNKKSLIYKIGEKLFFDVKETGNRYIISGVSGNEGTHTWTSENEVVFEFSLNKKIKNNLHFNLEASPYAHKQIVQFYANENFVGNFMVDSDGLSVIIPQEYVPDKSLQIKLLLPDSISPYELGEPGDKRLLGLSLQSLVIREIKEKNSVTESSSCIYYDSSVADRITMENPETYGVQLIGWHGYESAGQRWSTKSSQMIFYTNNTTGDLLLTLDYHQYQSNIETKVLLNGVPLCTLNNSSDPILLPHDLFNENGRQAITFHTPNAIVPSSRSESKDHRTLGICVKSFSITEN